MERKVYETIYSISKCNNYTLEEQAIINVIKNNLTITQEEIAEEINKFEIKP